MEFSQWLQKEMDKRQLTNYRLAKLSGVHQTTIANLLDGKKPQIETERKIREAISRLDNKKENPPVDDERFLPLAERREALSRAGIHIMLDADAKVTEEQLDDIISFIEIQQRRNGR